MAVTLPYPSLASGAVISHTELNENFSTLANKFGSITNSDVAAAAALSIDKLSASYEYMVVKLSGATTAAAIVDYVPIFNDGKGSWTVSGVQYVLIDAGSANCAIRIQAGYYTDASTTWNVTDNITAATTLTGTDATNYNGTISVTDSSFDPDPGAGDVKSIALSITGAGTASGNVYVGVMLKRQIKT